MKKRLIAIASLVLSAIILMATLSGCKLVTTDNERDMEQIVATVQISDKVDLDEIKKSDMIIAYLNYGYYYVTNYNYTQAQTYELILDGLIQNRIMVQSALIDASFANNNSVVDSLTDDAKVNAEYNAVKSIVDIVKSYAEADDKTPVGDTFIGTARAVPTDATKATKKLTVQDKKDFIQNNNLSLSSMTGKYRKGFNKVVELLNKNSLLGGYKDDNLKTTDYYVQTLKNYQESELLVAYQKEIEEKALKEFSFNDVANKYLEIYNKQKNFTNEEFISALSTATATEPILYSAYGTYGYVYNLLLGVTDIQSAEISKIKKDNANMSDQDYALARKAILDKDTLVKELRDSWVLSGYDFDGTKFTGDYTLVKDSANSFPFQGATQLLNGDDKDNENYVPEYTVTDVYSYDLNGFIAVMDAYLGGTKTETEYEGNSKTSVYGEKIYSLDGVAEYDKKVQELMFAFSTDAGSLNKTDGLVIKPPVDAGNNEEYVITFAEAGRKLLEVGSQSYVIVASDYGYHVIFFAKVLDGINFGSLSDYLDSLSIDKGAFATWEAYWQDMMSKYGNEDFDDLYKNNYLRLLTDTVTSSATSSAWSELVEQKENAYRYEEKKVVLFKNAYSDLLA